MKKLLTATKLTIPCTSGKTMLQIQLHKQTNAIYIVEIRKIAITLNLHRIYICRVRCRLRRLVIIVLGGTTENRGTSSWYQYRRNQGTTVVP